MNEPVFIGCKEWLNLCPILDQNSARLLTTHKIACGFCLPVVPNVWVFNQFCLHHFPPHNHKSRVRTKDGTYRPVCDTRTLRTDFEQTLKMHKQNKG
jgi:hypothetical protein